MKWFIVFLLVVMAAGLIIGLSASHLRTECSECPDCPDHSAELAQLEEADLILEFFWAWYQCERGMDRGECIAWMARVLKQLDNRELIEAFDDYLTCSACTPEEKEVLWQEYVHLAFGMLGNHVEAVH